MDEHRILVKLMHHQHKGAKAMEISGLSNGQGSFTFDPSKIISAHSSRYKVAGNYKFILAYENSYIVEASSSYNIN